MQKLSIICIDDQREVLVSLLKDLAELEAWFDILDCESAEEAEEAMDDIEREGGLLALIISDHVMPQKTGVQFLAEFRQIDRFPHTRQILLTGLATQQDTIEAINSARINAYIEKPWTRSGLLNTVRELTTEYVMDSGLDYKSYLPALDQQKLYAYLRTRG